MSESKSKSSNGSGEPNWNINPIRAVNLYRQEIYVDPEAGSIMVQWPITKFGSADPMRSPIFGGQCVVTTPGGQTPIQFPIHNVITLDEAIDAWVDALKNAVKELHNQAVRNQLVQGIGKAGSKLDMSKIRTK